MAYTIALQTPEYPVREELEWTTDLIRAYAGDEDRIPLNRYPKRSFSGQYQFDKVEDIRRHMAFMFSRFGTLLQLPLYHQQVKLKASVDAGVSSVPVNARRSDFRAGLGAFIVEGSAFEVKTVDAVAADAVTFTTPLVNDYSARAIVCPLTIAYTNNAAAFSRVNVDHSASASFRYVEERPWAPHVSPLNETELVFFDGLPVIEQPAVGTQFDAMLDSGVIVTDYIGLPDVFSPLDQSQWAFSLRWLVNRIFDQDAGAWWQTFADYVQGSYRPFLLPTHRADLPVLFPANGGAAQITIEGTEYSQHYWPLDTFARIVVSSAAGRHYAKVTGVDTIGGNDRLTFAPALPAGAGWNVDQRVSYLLKARIADDKIATDHYGLYSEVGMSVRTVD